MFGIDIPEVFYVKDPSGTDLGRRIISTSANLLKERGFNNFTLKKLANEIKSVEASIYRYFESKEHLLYYLLANYWSLVEFRLAVYTTGYDNAGDKLEKSIRILLGTENEEIPGFQSEVDFFTLHFVARENYFFSLGLMPDNDRYNGIRNAFKAQVNRVQNNVAELIAEVAPNFQHPKFLADTIINQSLYSVEELHMAGTLPDFEGYEQLAQYLIELIANLKE